HYTQSSQKPVSRTSAALVNDGRCTPRPINRVNARGSMVWRKVSQAFWVLALISGVFTWPACLSLQHSGATSSGPGGGGSAPGSAGNGGASPTTTLQAEIANNTSAPDSFAGGTNGNGKPGNVSKVPITTLLYPGANTKIYAHYMAWFGRRSHMNVGYRSDDEVQVKKQVEDMISRGIQGAIVDWYGPAATLEDVSTKLVMKQAEAHPGFTFAVVEDAGALVSAAEQSGCDATTQLIADLNYIASTYTASPAYMK